MNQWYVTAGDFVFFWPEQLKALSWLPTIWRSEDKFGWSSLQSLWLDYPFRIFIKLLYTLGISWWWTEKILWAGALALGLFASYRLATYVWKRRSVGILASLIYTTNTYALLLFGGGQLGVALAYALSPLVLLKFIQCTDQTTVYKGVFSIKYLVSSIKIGLWLALLVCFDLRLAYLMLGAVILYLVFSILYFV